MKIVIPDKIELSQTVLQKLNDLGAKVYDDLPKSEEEIIERVKDAEIITAYYIDITESIIEAAKNLKYIISPAVGYEWIDVEAANKRDIKVLNCPTHNSQTVAEHAMALMLSSIRQIVPADLDLQEGDFQPLKFTGTELGGKQLGLIGHGNIGKRIERFASSFGMKVSYIDSKSTEQDLEVLLKESDIVCICAPLTDNTRNLLNADRIALLKKSAYLINVARGPIVDQAALYKALQNNEIAGAGLDVFTDEPLVGKVNEEIVQLAKLSNVVATPHVGATTTEALNRLGEEIVEDIQSCLDGKPINVVN